MSALPLSPGCEEYERAVNHLRVVSLDAVAQVSAQEDVEDEAQNMHNEDLDFSEPMRRIDEFDESSKATLKEALKGASAAVVVQGTLEEYRR